MKMISSDTTLEHHSIHGEENLSKKNLIVVLGPTAVGKTAIAIELAKEFKTQIISADSRQFFREMHIGTAQPSVEEQYAVKHHFINSFSIKEEYNAARFEKDALQILNEIYKEKNIAVMCGGSGLYIHAVCNGFDDIPEASPEVRESILTLYKEKGIQGLREKLKVVDEEHYNKVDLSNPHRMIRAIEVCMVSGKPYSSLRKGKKQKRNFNAIKIGINTDRKKLYEGINLRVDRMMNEGLLEEVKSLQKYKHLNPLLTVGYKELFEYLDGKISLPGAVELIKQNTRNFAKRQLTWFRKDEEIVWFEPTEKEKIVDHIRTKVRK